MPKFATTRFYETVTYIQNYVACGLPANIRNDIATLINIADKPVLTGVQLANQLIGMYAQVQPGRFANFPVGPPGPVFNVFGNGVGNAVVHGSGNGFYAPKVPGAVAGQMKWMSIFGRCLGGAWKIYTQSVDGVNAIMERRRIF